jgi:folate-dependent tRNA-U54 methylase TrmFO/GidA
MGIVAAVNAARKAEGKAFLKCPLETVTGNLISIFAQCFRGLLCADECQLGVIQRFEQRKPRRNYYAQSEGLIECYWSSAQ